MNKTFKYFKVVFVFIVLLNFISTAYAMSVFDCSCTVKIEKIQKSKSCCGSGEKNLIPKEQKKKECDRCAACWLEKSVAEKSNNFQNLETIKSFFSLSFNLFQITNFHFNNISGIKSCRSPDISSKIFLNLSSLRI
jgi:hypothetical protein